MIVHNSEEIPSTAVCLLLDIFYDFMGAMQIARKYFGNMCGTHSIKRGRAVHELGRIGFGADQSSTRLI